MVVDCRTVDSYAGFARFYDLDVTGPADDLLMIEQFCARCGSPILELGCGTGRLLLPLALKGYHVTGVDSSPAMLDLARLKLGDARMAGRVELVERDMRSLDMHGGFNLAYCVLNSFLHMLTLDDQLAALRSALRCLNAGGLLVLDVFNPDLARLLEPAGQISLENVLTNPDNGRPILKKVARMVDLGRQLIHTTYCLDELDDEGRVKRTVYPFVLRYVFRSELELLLRCAGFQIDGIYGSADLDEFTGVSERIVAIGRKVARSDTCPT